MLIPQDFATMRLTQYACVTYTRDGMVGTWCQVRLLLFHLPVVAFVSPSSCCLLTQLAQLTLGVPSKTYT